MKRVYQPVKKKTILIVDDNHLATHIYREKFQRRGFKVHAVTNRNDALRTLKKEPVDLVALDLCLPGLDGAELLKDIRAEFDMQTLPVVVFSNAYLRNMERSALKAGATQCVVKAETTPDQLLEIFQRLLPAGQSSAALPNSEAAISDSSETRVDQSEIDSRQKLLAIFLSDTPEILAKLRADHQVFVKTEEEDLRRVELGKMHRQVHSLGDSANLLYLRKIGRMANALEALFTELTARPEQITSSVIRTIAQAIDTLTALCERAAPAENETSAPAKILVVDDDAISREMICAALGKANLPAESLDNSIAAQRLLEQEHFDLIFLDVEMPEQTGHQLCVKIREMTTNRATPVVFVTAHSDFGNRARSTLSGGNDFIAKPFLWVELAIKALTYLFRKSLLPLSTVTAPNTATAPSTSPECVPSFNAK